MTNSKPTQRQRVLDALQRVGIRGLTQIDFQPPSVIDGGPPITRVAARIEELRADGYRIDNQGRRDKCSVYVLRGHATPRQPLERPPASAPALFDDAPQHAIFDFDDAA